MTTALRHESTLNRRAWLVLAGTALAGCGGGGLGDLVGAVAPGVGGTGAVFSQGTISGFGSVVVNAVKYDDSAAMVLVNGQSAAPQDLRLGMVAEVNGERTGTDPLTGAALGKASGITVWSIAEGPISGMSYTGAVLTSVQVMGMQLSLDGNTNLDTTPLAVNQSVVVWGLVANEDATQWRATRVQVQQDSTLRMSTGRVQHTDGQVMLNGVTLSGQAVIDLQDGQMVRVQGTQTDSASLTVSQVWQLDAGLSAPTDSGLDVEVEGFVTSTPVSGKFKVGSISVDASASALASSLGELCLGARLEVYGRWADNTLVANKIELKSQISDDGSELEIIYTVEIEGTIDSFTSAADFVMRGQRCNADQATYEYGTASDLQAAFLNQTRIKIDGHYEGAILMVAALEFDHED